MSQKRLIAREIAASKEFLVGRVLSVRTLKFADPAASTEQIWVSDVGVAGNRILRDVPIKLSGSGTRFYASLDQSVLLRRNVSGRFDIVGPADRKIGNEVRKFYTRATGALVSTVNLDFTFRVEAFEFYEGGNPTPGSSLWNDGTTFFPKTTTIDALGDEV